VINRGKKETQFTSGGEEKGLSLRGGEGKNWRPSDIPSIPAHQAPSKREKRGMIIGLTLEGVAIHQGRSLPQRKPGARNRKEKGGKLGHSKKRVRHH